MAVILAFVLAPAGCGSQSGAEVAPSTNLATREQNEALIATIQNDPKLSAGEKQHKIDQIRASMRAKSR